MKGYKLPFTNLYFVHVLTLSNPNPVDAVNGKWGKWGPWTTCSELQFCDLGEKTRTRKCDSPSPSKGGDLCPGLDTEDEICPKEKCKRKNIQFVTMISQTLFIIPFLLAKWVHHLIAFSVPSFFNLVLWFGISNNSCLRY